MRVAVHLAEGFEEIEAVSIIDVLRRADIDTTIVSITGKKELKGAHGITVYADEIFENTDYEKIELIVLPGGMPGSKNLNEHEGLKSKIKEFADKNKKLAAICAAPMVYGNMGLLKGKKAVCYPGIEKYLNGAEILNEEVVYDGNIITGRGPGAALKFSLKIVEIMKGREIAEKLKNGMLVS